MEMKTVAKLKFWFGQELGKSIFNEEKYEVEIKENGFVHIKEREEKEEAKEDGLQNKNNKSIQGEECK